MPHDAAFRLPPLAVSARIAEELALLDASSYERFCSALNAADEALRSQAGALPSDGNIVVFVFDVGLFIRFHDAKKQFYVCAFILGNDDDPDPRDPTAAADDWIGDTTICNASGRVTIALKHWRPKTMQLLPSRHAHRCSAQPNVAVTIFSSVLAKSDISIRATAVETCQSGTENDDPSSLASSGNEISLSPPSGIATGSAIPLLHSPTLPLSLDHSADLQLFTQTHAVRLSPNYGNHQLPGACCMQEMT